MLFVDAGLSHISGQDGATNMHRINTDYRLVTQQRHTAKSGEDQVCSSTA